jgi:hypothetical protein
VPHSEATGLPLRILAWRQYGVTLHSGCRVEVGFSLSDPQDSTIAAIKAKYTASHLGFVIVLGDPDSPEEPVLWLRQAGVLTMMSQNGAMLLSQEIRTLLPRYFTAFFDEMKDIAPDLADVLFVGVPRANDHHLN